MLPFPEVRGVAQEEQAGVLVVSIMGITALVEQPIPEAVVAAVLALQAEMAAQAWSFFPSQRQTIQARLQARQPLQPVAQIRS
jgi:class 3 adenylate cyclase